MNPFELDHYYLALKREAFEAARALLEDRYQGVYKVRQSQETTRGWEGVYLNTKNRTYFEVLLESPETPHGTVGIALSSRDPNFETIEFCRRSYPGTEEALYKDDSGQPWFTSISKARLPENYRAYVWIMAYEGRYRSQRFSAVSVSESDVTLYVSQKAFQDITYYRDFLPDNLPLRLVPTDGEPRFEVS